MLLQTIFLAVFSSNSFLNLLFAILVVIVCAAIGYYGLDKAGAFPLKGVVYVVGAILLIILFLFLIGVIPG